MSEAILLPCPFCRGTNTQIKTDSHWTGMSSKVISATAFHWCERQEGELQSAISIKRKTEDAAIAAWNTRAAAAMAKGRV